VTTPRLLAAAYLALVAVGLDLPALARLRLPAAGPALPWLAAACCLVVLLAVGELWLRALTGEAVPAVARLGLGVATGLMSLPLVTIGLHVSGIHIRGRSLAWGLAALVTVLGAVVLAREHRSGRVPADPRFPRTLGAIAIPGVATLVVGGAATMAYVRMPHPPQPGYTSVALGGWAAGIDSPVAFPARGLDVPLRVSSAGEPAAVAPLRVRVGDRTVAPPRPVTIAADRTSSVEVHVPAPPNGCLHRIEISLGSASTVFYGRGPAKC
jgi:hypothetical protein